jgi:hypothetical protein
MASGSPTSRVQPYRSSSQGPIGSLPGYVGSYGPLGNGAATSVSAHAFGLGLGLTTHRPGVTPLPYAIPPTAASFRHGSGAPFRSRIRSSSPGRHRRSQTPGHRSGSQYARASDLYPPGAGPRMLPGGPLEKSEWENAIEQLTNGVMTCQSQQRAAAQYTSSLETRLAAVEIKATEVVTGHAVTSQHLDEACSNISKRYAPLSQVREEFSSS